MTQVTTQTPTRHTRVIIAHGYMSSPHEHWFPWLDAQASSFSVAVTRVHFPHAHAPKTQEWVHTLEQAVIDPDEKMCIVAHSLGCYAVLRFLQNRGRSLRLGQLIFVSGFMRPLPLLPELDSFLDEKIFPHKIAPKIQERIMIHSHNDSIVPPTYSQELATALECVTLVEPEGQHFLADNGYTTFPLVAAQIRRFILAQQDSS